MNCLGKSQLLNLNSILPMNISLIVVNTILWFIGVYWPVWHFTVYNSVLLCINESAFVYMGLDLHTWVFEGTPHSTLAVNATPLESGQNAVCSYLWRNSFQAFHYSSSFLRISSESRGGGRERWKSLAIMCSLPCLFTYITRGPHRKRGSIDFHLILGWKEHNQSILIIQFSHIFQM